MKEAYDDLIEAYTYLETKDKREQILKELKTMTAVFQKVCNNREIASIELINKELIDLNRSKVSEDDYLEGVYVYICWLKHLTTAYLNKMENRK